MLASWALPKGLPERTDRNNKAIRTEDHPIEYLEFEGEIPKGQYGAGTMEIWDSGTYETDKFRDDEVIVTLLGERASGKYALFQAGDSAKDWLIHRMDEPAQAAEPMPEQIVPMMARLSKLPADEEGLGVRDQVGRRAGDRLFDAGRSPAREPQPEGHHRALSGASPPQPGARLAQRRPRRRDRLLRGRRAQLREAAAADAPDPRAGDPPAGQSRAGQLPDLRPALPRRSLADGRSPTRSAGDCWRGWNSTARPGRPPPSTAATARPSSPGPPSSGSRGSSPSG